MPGAAFRNPWKPDPPGLSGFLPQDLSWVGSCVLAQATAFIVSPSICHEVVGSDAMILVF